MKKSFVASAIAVAFAGGLFAAQFGAHDFLVGDSHAVPDVAAPAAGTTPAAAAPVLALPDFSALVESQGPAVVNISVARAARQADAQIPGM